MNELADLKARRERSEAKSKLLRDALDMIRRPLVDISGVAVSKTAKSAVKTTKKVGESRNELSIQKWALKILQDARKPLDSAEVAIQMLSEGYKTDSDESAFLQTVHSTGIIPLVRRNEVEAVGERPNVKYQIKKD